MLLAAVQAYGIAVGLEGMRGGVGSAVIDPGHRSSAWSRVITLTGGTVFLMWLGEQITARGVGNGISLIIFAGIVANLPHALAATLELGRTGALSPCLHHLLPGDVGRRRRLHRLHGAGAAAHPGAVPETPGRATACSAARPRICR